MEVPPSELSRRLSFVRHYYDGTRRGNVTDGRARMAGEAIRGQPDPPAGGGLRMLGSLSDADDAVQEAWLRLSRSDPSGTEDLGRWLTTGGPRGCLEMLRYAEAR